MNNKSSVYKIRCLRKKSLLALRDFLFNTLKYTLPPIFIGISILLFSYMIIPKFANIDVKATPSNLELNNFTGEVLGDFHSIVDSKNFINTNITNTTPLEVEINNKTYSVDQFQLKIVFGESSNMSKYGIPYASVLSCDKPLQCDINLQSYNLNFSNSGNLSPYSINHDTSYNLSLDNEINNFSVFSQQKKYKLTVQGNVNIYIDGAKVVQPGYPVYILDITSPNDLSIFNFSKTSNAMMFFLDSGNYISMKGIASEIAGETTNGNLTFDQKVQSSSVHMDYKNFGFYSESNSRLNFNFSQADNNIVEINGNVREATVNQATLFLTPMNWFLANYATIISTIVVVLLSMLLSGKSK